MSEERPTYQTYRRFQSWVRNGKLEQHLKPLAARLHEQGKLNLDEGFVEATFASAKKVGFAVGPIRCGKSTNIVATAAVNSLSLFLSP